MPTLEDLNLGASLVPDLGPSLGLLKEGVKTFQTRQATRAVSEATTPEQEAKAMLQLSATNPLVAQAMQGVLQRKDRKEMEAASKEVRKGLELVTLLKSRDYNAQTRILMDQAHLKVGRGEDPRRDLELKEMGKDQRNLEFERMNIAGTATETLLKRPEQEAKAKREQEARDASGILQMTPEQRAIALPELRFKAQREGDSATVNFIDQLSPLSPAQQDAVLRDVVRQVPQAKPVSLAKGARLVDPTTGQEIVGAAPAQPTATFEPVFADDGKTIIGQRNTVTGEIKTDPRAIKDTTLIQTLKSIGVDPGTPEGKALVKKILTTAKTKISIGDEKLPFDIPKGFMLLDENDHTKGVTPIPGGPKDNLSGESAGKAQMLRTAQKGAKGIKSLVFDKKGEIDKVNLVNAAIGTPGTKGRELRQKMEFGIQAITRIETGAAMPQEELDNTRTRFMPSPLDSKEIINLKLRMFNDFIGGTLKLLDPAGRFNAERFQAELEERADEVGISTAPAVPQGDAPTGQRTAEDFEIFKRPDGSTYAVAP